MGRMSGGTARRSSGDLASRSLAPQVSPDPKTVLVIGASRGIGLEAVKHCLRRGHRVRALARSAESIPISDARLEKRNGNALDRDDVAASLVGVDAVVLALGIPLGPEMALKPVRLFSQCTRVVVSEMSSAGVKRLICVTGYGAGDSRASIGCLQGAVFRFVLGRAYDDKSIQERMIRASDLDWVIARPTFLTRGPATGCYKVIVEPRGWRNGFISRSDVADFLVRQVDDDALLGQTPVLTY